MSVTDTPIERHRRLCCKTGGRLVSHGADAAWSAVALGRNAPVQDRPLHRLGGHIVSARLKGRDEVRLDV